MGVTFEKEDVEKIWDTVRSLYYLEAKLQL